MLPYTFHWTHHYPAHTCVKGLRNQFCLSASQSVCPVKNFEISIFTWLNNCCTQQWHGNLKKMYVYLIETKAVHFSAFPALFYLTLVLSTILIRSTTWIQWRPGICRLQARVYVHQPPRSQDCEKLAGRLDEVSQLLHEVSHLFVRPVSYYMKLVSK